MRAGTERTEEADGSDGGSGGLPFRVGREFVAVLPAVSFAGHFPGVHVTRAASMQASRRYTRLRLQQTVGLYRRCNGRLKWGCEGGDGGQGNEICCAMAAVKVRPIGGHEAVRQG